MTIRQPIISVLGHVDHGKTTLLDYIRGSALAKKEAGLITQHIGANEVPREVIENTCGILLKKTGIKIRVPGLLFIDTPGHEAFTNLRKRGGSIADIAVLVIDALQGVQNQTVEAIEILKTYKTPFVVALNKIDKLTGWIPSRDTCFLDTLDQQTDQVKELLDKKLYETVGQLGQHGFASERFDRVEDFKKEILIIPLSAATGEGVADLLMYITGLVEKYLEKRLQTHEHGHAKGSVLEVKEEKGLGTTADVIIYDGVIKQGDTLVALGKNGAIQTKIRALLKPKGLTDLRESREKFVSVKEASAACGVKISAPGLESIIPGSPIETTDNAEAAKKRLETEMKNIKIETDALGVVLKADTIGSLEAIVGMLKNKKIPVKNADVGTVSKKDVSAAETVSQENKYLGVVLAFNTSLGEGVEKASKNLRVKVFSSDVIYKLLENYEEWVAKQKQEEKQEALKEAVFPAELKILPGCIFRKNNPAIFGVEVVEGTIKPGYKLMLPDGKIVGKIKEIQDKKENLAEAKKGAQIALCVPKLDLEKDAGEGDTLYTAVNEEKIQKLLEDLSAQEQQLLEKILKIREEKRNEGGD